METYNQDIDVKEYFSEYFAELFDTVRKNKDGTYKSLDEMADMIKMPKASLSNYVNGKREPKISSLMTIARFFNVSPNELLGYDGEDCADKKIIDMHVHTGLSRQSINILHKKKDDPFFMAVLNFLIEDQEDGVGILDDIVDYTISDLWDDLAKDERYNTLPGSASDYATGRNISTAEANRKESLLCLTDKLPEVRDAFHANVISCNSKVKRRYIRELAMKNLHLSTIVKILYPQYVLDYLEAANLLKPGHVGLTDELIVALEKQIRADITKNHPEIEDVQGATPVSFCDLAEYDEFTAVANNFLATQEEKSEHRQQALSYLKEYREYLKEKTE